MRAEDTPLTVDENAFELGDVSDLYELLRAIDEVMPKHATLYVEGTSIAPEVARFLAARQSADPPEVERHTGWPKPQPFHLPLAGRNLAELRAIADRYAEPEICDHLVVYCGGTVLLYAHDAGDGYVLLSRELPPETHAQLRETLAGVLRDPATPAPWSFRRLGRWLAAGRGDPST